MWSMKNEPRKITLPPPPIVGEVSLFLGENPSISERELALAAGIPPESLNRVKNRVRHDMMSENADKLRIAMKGLRPDLPTPVVQEAGGE